MIYLDAAFTNDTAILAALTAGKTYLGTYWIAGKILTVSIGMGGTQIWPIF